MTTFPHPDSQLSFAAIDAHVETQSASSQLQAELSAQQRLIARYNVIRPILIALSVIALIPPTWRATLRAFMTTADEVALLGAADPFGTQPIPPPVAQPDFKAGKDQ
jgi:hypothetical protein